MGLEKFIDEMDTLSFDFDQYRDSAVLVQVTGMDPISVKSSQSAFFRSEDGMTSLSCSGTLWRDQSLQVFCTAFPILPFLQPQIRTLFRSLSSRNKPFDHSISQNDILGQTEISIIFRNQRVKATLTRLFIHQSFYNDLKSLTDSCSSWNMGWNSENIVSLAESAAIAVLSLEELAVDLDLPKMYQLSSNSLKATNVRYVSSPFGCVCSQVFTNHVSQSFVANVFNSLLVLDDRAAPGSEGSPIFKDGFIIGFRTFPLRLSNTMIVPIGIFFPSLVTVSTVNLSKPIRLERSPDLSAQKCIFQLEIAQSWASGIMISAGGYSITSAHLLRPFIDETGLNTQLRAKLRPENYSETSKSSHPDEVWFSCSLVYIFPENNWDIALVKVNCPHSLCSAPPPSKNVSEGDAVLSMGFPLFSAVLDQYPSIYPGIVSRIIQRHSKSVLYVSSASVFKGCSGGILLKGTDNSFLGVVTCNLQLKNQNPTKSAQYFPNINFSIPSSILMPIISYFKTLNLPSAFPDNLKLQAIVHAVQQTFDEHVSELWNLTACPEQKEIHERRRSILDRLMEKRQKQMPVQLMGRL